jgi:hypothetical protein
VRRLAAIVCFVLAAVLPAVAVGAAWVYANATDTARFERTAAPLASDDTVQDAVAEELTRVATQRIGALANGVPLPGGASGVQARVRTLADALVRSPSYQATWRTIQRSAHERLATRLDGDVTAPLTLDLAPLAGVLRTRVRAAGLAPVADAIPDPAPVVLLDRAEVKRAHDATTIVRILRAIAIPGAVLALLGVLLLAGGLARGLVRAGVAVGVSTGLLVASVALGRTAIAGSGTQRALRRAVYDVLTDPLHHWMIGGGAIAVALIAVGAAVSAVTAGPARRA